MSKEVNNPARHRKPPLPVAAATPSAVLRHLLQRIAPLPAGAGNLCAANTTHTNIYVCCLCKSGALLCQAALCKTSPRAGTGLQRSATGGLEAAPGYQHADSLDQHAGSGERSGWQLLAAVGAQTNTGVAACVSCIGLVSPLPPRRVRHAAALVLVRRGGGANGSLTSMHTALSATFLLLALRTFKSCLCREKLWVLFCA